MTDWAMSGRRDTYSFVPCDPFTLEPNGEAVEVEYGASSLTFGYYTDNYYSGDMSALSEFPEGSMVRVEHTATLPTGEAESEELATCFVTDESDTASVGQLSRGLTLYSPYYRFTEDVLVRDFFRSQGYNVVQAIRDIVEADGGILRVVGDVNTAKAFGCDIWFELDTSRSTVLSTIAGWIGCKMGVDGHGRITISPTPDFSTAEPVYEFEAQDCVYTHGYEVYDNNDDKVNRVLAYSSTEEYTASAYVDLPATDPFSYERIGRRVTYVISESEEMTEAELKAEAQEYLDANHGSIWYYEIEHVGVPGLSIGDVVTYSNSLDGEEAVSAKCLVTEIDMTLGAGCMCKTKLKVVG